MSEQKQDNKFLGETPVGRLLRMFAIPCVLSLVIQALYNIVDQIFIGNAGYLPFGNTATGFVYPLTVVAMAIGLWLGDGIAACMSINQGRNNNERTPYNIGTGLTVGLVASLLLCLICNLAINPILQFFGAGGQALTDAVEYSGWIIAGFPLFILACVMNPVVRADGSPKFAMIAMAAGAVLNIILDPLLINVAHMGMTGAALATFIGQAVTFILHVAYFFKIKCCRLTWRHFIPRWGALMDAIKLGVSSFLTQFSIVIIAVVNSIVISKYFVSYENGLPVTNEVGIMNVAFKIFGIIISVVIGVAAGAQPILGYNYGAQKYDRVRKTWQYVLISSVIVGVIATILFEAIPQLLLGLFGYSAAGYTAAEINFGLNLFRIYMGAILLTCVIKAIAIFFQAIGKPARAMLVALLRDVIFVVPLAIGLPLITPDAFLWSAPIADVLTTIVAVILLVMVLRSMKTAKVTQDHATVALQPSKPGVIITIAREHGAGGREIGKILAKTLEIPYYDKEIISLAAEESGLAAEYIHDLEKKSSLMYNTYLATTANQTAIQAQAQVLKRIAQQGTCVIVGRAANFVLQDFHPYSVFVYAPIEYRVERVRRNYEDTQAQAVANINRADQRRAKFYQTITGQKWADHANYDLALDGSLGVQACVAAIIENLGKNHK